jgi:O-antigen ligase
LSLNNSDAATSQILPMALPLMLSIVFLSLFEAGFDHNVIYWVLLPLSASMIYFTLSGHINYRLVPGKPAFFLLLFWLWAGISIFWSLNPHRTLVEFLQLAICVLVYVLASNLDEVNSFRVGRIALIAGLGVALFGISQYLFISSSRIESTIANANSLGIYLAMLFLLGWGYYLRKPNRFIAFTSVILLIALILTMSRGSFISLSICLPLIFVGLKKSELKSALKKTLICIVCSLALTQLVIYVAPYLQNIVGDNLVLSYILSRRAAFVAWSGTSRFAFWKTGFDIFIANPLNGTGLGTFFLAYFTEYVDNIWYARFVHNHYIQTLSELGLVGFGLLLAFLVQLARSVWQQMKSKVYPAFYPGLLAAMVAFFIHIGGDFSWNFPAVAVLFFALAGTATSISADEADLKPQNKLSKTVQAAVLLIIFTLSLWQFSANLLYKQGIEQEAYGEIEEAAATYDLANRIYPINSMAYSFAGNTYYAIASENQDLTLLNEAIVRLEKAVILSPVDGNLHNQLGRYYWMAGRMEEAEQHLKLAADYAAYRIGLLIDLAWFYIQQERFEEARPVVEKGLDLKDYAQGMHPSEEDREKVKQQIETLYQLQKILEEPGS